MKQNPASAMVYQPSTYGIFTVSPLFGERRKHCSIILDVQFYFISAYLASFLKMIKLEILLTKERNVVISKQVRVFVGPDVCDTNKFDLEVYDQITPKA